MWKWVTMVLCSVVMASAGCCAEYDGILQKAKNRAMAGDFTIAIGLCTGVINAHLGAPIEPRARLLLGHILNKKRVPEADSIGQFAQLVASFPNSPEAPQALLRIGYLRERLKQDPDEWQQVVRYYPLSKEAAEALHCLGHQALRRGDAVEATAKFDASAAVAEAAPSVVADSLMESGYACISHYWQCQDFDALVEAAVRLRRVENEATDPAMVAKGQMGLGEVYLIRGLYDNALAKYEEVLNGSPHDAFVRSLAQFEIACCLQGKNDYAGAVAALDRFISSCSGSTLRSKDAAWKTARPGYADLLAKDPQSVSKLCALDLIPEAVCCKARALSKLHRYDEADRLAAQVLSEFPNAGCIKRAEQVRKLCAAVQGR